MHKSISIVHTPGTTVVWISSRCLETASQRIADYHGIPEVVKGAVITAVASSFPELSSVIIATLAHGEFELGVAAIVGSAIFNILVIPSLSVLIGGRLSANRDLVYKEALFYFVAIVALLLTFALAVIYFPAGGQAIRELTRGLALIPLGSNTFDLLVAIPVGVLLGGATVVNFSRAVPAMGCLSLATLVLFVCLRQGMSLRRIEGAVLLALYVMFVALMVLESFGFSNLLSMRA